jgi:hypothetical protein
MPVRIDLTLPDSPAPNAFEPNRSETRNHA